MGIKGLAKLLSDEAPEVRHDDQSLLEKNALDESNEGSTAVAVHNFVGNVIQLFVIGVPQTRLVTHFTHSIWFCCCGCRVG